jgi:hypothetical protein
MLAAGPVIVRGTMDLRHEIELRNGMGKALPCAAAFPRAPPQRRNLHLLCETVHGETASVRPSRGMTGSGGC